MQSSRTLRRLLAIASTFAVATLGLAGPASGAPAAKAVHCTVAVVSVDESGLATLGRLECTAGGVAATASASFGISSVTIATHYAGLGFTGSTLTVTGPGCTGYYINVPAAWVDVISSTRSSCTVTHYDYFYMQGPTMTVFNPGGNLTGFDNKTNSAQYL